MKRREEIQGDAGLTVRREGRRRGSRVAGITDAGKSRRGDRVAESTRRGNHRRGSRAAKIPQTRVEIRVRKQTERRNGASIVVPNEGMFGPNPKGGYRP